MRVKIKRIEEIDAKETNTQGKNAYVVALCCGGVLEDPYFFTIMISKLFVQNLKMKQEVNMMS